jgi:HAD superfamily phosphatase (TIGR01668 family)
MITSSYYRSLMYRYLRPNMIYESIYDIDFHLLWEDGTRHLFFDVDNTLISYDESDVSVQCLNTFNDIASIGFETITLISNNSSVARIERVSSQLKLPAVTFACKPFVFTLRRLMADGHMVPHTCALVGDQLMTDVLLANYMGLTSIFVEPLTTDGISALKSLQYRFQEHILTTF